MNSDIEIMKTDQDLSDYLVTVKSVFSNMYDEDALEALMSILAVAKIAHMAQLSMAALIEKMTKDHDA